MTETITLVAHATGTVVMLVTAEDGPVVPEVHEDGTAIEVSLYNDLAIYALNATQTIRLATIKEAMRIEEIETGKGARKETRKGIRKVIRKETRKETETETGTETGTETLVGIIIDATINGVAGMMRTPAVRRTKALFVASHQHQTLLATISPGKCATSVNASLTNMLAVPRPSQG